MSKRDFATVYKELHELVEALAELSLIRTPEDLNEENVHIMQDLARVAQEAVVAQGTAWLRYTVEFGDTGSDVDTVALALSALKGCVLKVDGIRMVYEGVDAHGEQIYLQGDAYPVTGKRTEVPLWSGTTITVI